MVRRKSGKDETNMDIGIGIYAYFQPVAVEDIDEKDAVYYYHEESDQAYEVTEDEITPGISYYRLVVGNVIPEDAEKWAATTKYIWRRLTTTEKEQLDEQKNSVYTDVLLREMR